MGRFRFEWLIGTFFILLVACSGGTGGTGDGGCVCPGDLVCDVSGLCVDPAALPDTGVTVADGGSSEDGGRMDAATADAGSASEDAGPVTADAASPVVDAGPGSLAVEILMPIDYAREMEDVAVMLRGQATGPALAGGIAVWESSIDGELARAPLASDGMTTATVPLSAGFHDITLRVTTMDGMEAMDIVRGVGVCGWRLISDFSGALTGDWELFGNAARDPGGWLELTGNAMGRRGAIYYTASRISPGDADFRFRISTGGGINTGADGFAMNVFAVADAAALRAIVPGTSGSGLGYAVGGPYGSYAGDAFHVEFDTWNNRYNGSSELHSDPTSQPHVEITLNGDAGNSVAYANVPDLENNMWHDIEVQIEGSTVRVTYDGREIINRVVADLAFQGGYIGFSGSTGWATNYHRFDDLAVRDGCY